MSIVDRLYVRCGEPVNLEKRTDTASGVGTIIESYTVFATALMAKVVEVGTLHAGSEQVEEGATHLVTIANFTGAETAEYVMYGVRRMRVQRMRMIGPPDVRFMQYMCEEIEKNA